MKTLLTTLVAIALGLIALPEKAEARPCHVAYGKTYISGYTSCGCSIYTRRVVTGYDCRHRPIYRYYRLPVSHCCRSYSRSLYKSRCNSYRGISYYGSYRHGRSTLRYGNRYGSVSICR